jgi:hypothetical protein
MKDVDFAGVTPTLPPAAPNGAHQIPKKKGATPKRPAESGARSGVRPAPRLIAAEFTELEAKAVDAPMWLLHSVLWFQPEGAPVVPVWTGLAIERHNRIPTPDFLHTDTSPPNRPDTLDNSRDALTPESRMELPPSGLEPLGWEPRAVSRKEESQ